MTYFKVFKFSSCRLISCSSSSHNLMSSIASSIFFSVLVLLDFSLIILLCDQGDAAVSKRKGCHSRSSGQCFLTRVGISLFNACASISARCMPSRAPLHFPHPLFLWQSLYLSQKIFEPEAWVSPGVRIAVNVLS